MVGFDEIIFIAIVALLLFGPDKLPGYLREMGRLYAEVKKAQHEFERELSAAAISIGAGREAAFTKSHGHCHEDGNFCGRKDGRPAPR